MVYAPRSSNCFSGSLFPLDTLFSNVDHISFFGAACVFRRSRESEKGFEVVWTAVDAILAQLACEGSVKREENGDSHQDNLICRERGDVQCWGTPRRPGIRVKLEDAEVV